METEAGGLEGGDLAAALAGGLRGGCSESPGRRWGPGRGLSSRLTSGGTGVVCVEDSAGGQLVGLTGWGGLSW